jgi:hypothetical protein
MRGCLLAVAVVALLPVLAHGARHVGAQNPPRVSGRSRRETAASPDKPWAGDPDFPSVHAWQINGNASGRLRYEAVGPDLGEAWTLSARLRVVEPDLDVDAGKLIEVSNGTTRFMLFFGTANGATLVNVVGTPASPDFEVTPSQPGRSDYVHVVLAYDPDLGAATVLVNGELVTADAAGIAAAGIASRVNFGDGAGAAAGTTRWADVRFTTGAQACRDGLDNDGDGLVDFAGGDPDCLSAADPTEGVYCPAGEDLDGDGRCEQIFIAHQGDIDPAAEGWQTPSAAGGQSWQPADEDLGAGNCEAPCPFWRIRDNGTASGNLGTYRISPFPHNYPGGWEVRAVLRVDPLTPGIVEPPRYSRTLYARFPDGGGSREFGLQFGVTAGGDMLVRSTSVAFNHNVGSTYDYHDVRLVYDPVSGTADLLVDGEVLREDIPERHLAVASMRCTGVPPRRPRLAASTGTA